MGPTNVASKAPTVELAFSTLVISLQVNLRQSQMEPRQKMKPLSLSNFHIVKLLYRCGCSLKYIVSSITTLQSLSHCSLFKLFDCCQSKIYSCCCFLEKFVLLCGNSLNRIELVAPLFLLFLLIFAKALGCNVIF